MITSNLVLIFFFTFEMIWAKEKLRVGTPNLLEVDVTTPVRMQENLHEIALSTHYRTRRSVTYSQPADEEFSNPVYKLTAFGEDLMIRLKPDESLLAPSFTTTYSWKNNSDNFSSPSQSLLRGCFYKGVILGKPSSQVALSICDSLTGSLYTDDYHYFITPLQEKISSDNLIPHHIKRRSIKSKRFSSGHGSSCGVNDASHEREYRKTFLNSPIEEIADNIVKQAERTKRAIETSQSKKNVIDFELDDVTEAHSRTKRSSFDSRQYYIETLVVADSSMIREHGDDLEHYILSIMMIANRIFSHPSLGSAVAISVVKIMILEDGDDAPPVSTNAGNALHDFCTWQRKHNTPDDSDPEHYDLAVLLTKTDLCGDSCDTLGMAEVGAMCSTRHSCAIVEDDGLSASYTVAHEVGHVLNMMHDDNRLCREYFANVDSSSHLMSSTMDRVDSDQPWSHCSRQAVIDFLQDGRGDCLLDKPQIPKVYPRDLPGVMYDVNAQCAMSFGSGSTECPYMRECGRLWCQIPSGSRANQCYTRSFPRADGSPCAKGMHCMQGQCIPQGSRMASVDGQWGEWSQFGSCSRTCGGGVYMSSRQCNNPSPRHGGKYCIGSRLKFRSCNIEKCPSHNHKNQRDFRSEQCTQYDGQRFPLLGVRVASTWIPKYSEIHKRDRCKLICQSVQTGSYVTLSDRVVDGTRCGPDTTDICVHGQCMPAGCDGILGSKAKYNKCGICKGNKSQCRRIKGKYNKRRSGYSDVVTIPVGAATIKIQQRGLHNKIHDGNYLALINKDGRYLVNGALTLSTLKKDIDVDGSILQYTGVEVAKEKIEAKMPLKEPITVQVLSLGLSGSKILPPRISYSYYIPRPKRKSRKSKISRTIPGSSTVVRRVLKPEPTLSTPPTSEAPEEDKWVSGRWRKCKAYGNRNCGSGWKKRSVTCKRGKKHSSRCDVSKKPHQRLPCSISDCPTATPIHRASPISSRHNKDGATLVDVYRNRNERPVWNAGMWGACSASCGLGRKMRVVICQSRSGKLLSPSKCDPRTKPSHAHGCKLRDCR